MSKPRIIADDKIPFLKGALEEVSEITYVPGSEINNRMVKEADALIIRTRTKCNKDLLDGSNVKFIASATIGFDHIDTGYCSMESIQWTNAPGCNSSSVEQYVTAALMNLAEKHGFLLKEKTLGIIGVGNVGQKVSRIAHSLGMHVLHNDPPREKQEGSLGFHSLDKIKEEADFISFHVPLNIAGEYRTLDFVNQDFIHELKKNVMVINTSRGEIMEEDTFLEHLKKGKIADSVIDVWKHEPNINHELLKHSGIATPHIAGYSVDGKAKGTEMSVQAVSRFFGFGLDHWTTRELPGPIVNQIVIDCGGMDEQEILTEVYLQTYDIKKDDEMLRKDPDKFEELRGNYPVRREPSYYTLKLNNNPFEHLNEILDNLGFSVLEHDCFC